MSKSQIRADVTPEQKAWLESQGKNLSQTIRDILTRVMPGGAQHVDVNEVDDRHPQIRFLEAVEKFYRFARSCEVAKVDPAEMTAQLEECADFKAAFQSAQQRFTEDIEWLVIECAKGEKKIDKSGMTGLIAWLNNNHPSWGRVKAEMIQRIFGPLFTDMLKAANEEIGNSRTYKKLVARWESIKELRLLPFSD